MQSNPARAQEAQNLIRQAMAALTARGVPLTKRALAEEAGCSATTVMKYRALWQADAAEPEPGEPAAPNDPLALTVDNLAAWQELDALFDAPSVQTRLWGFRYDEVTPPFAAYWQAQHARLEALEAWQPDKTLRLQILRPYRDRVWLVEEVAYDRWPAGRVKAVVAYGRSVNHLQLPLPADRRFLDLAFPAAAWDHIAALMEETLGHVRLEESYATRR